MKKIIILFFLLFILYEMNSQTIISDSIINNYAKVVAIDYCSNSISIPTGNGIQFKVGEKILLIQMKGATLNESNNLFNGTLDSYNGAGNYEINQIRSINSSITDDLVLEFEIERLYEPSGFVQIVSIPQYQDVVFQNELTCTAWNGDFGGILIFKALNSVTLQADINVSKKGFRGALAVDDISGGCFGFNGFTDYNCINSQNCGALKGEGIGNRYETQEQGRAINANGGGGGNDHNGGGGGGSCFGKGGQGGMMTNTFCNGPGGLGADVLEYSSGLNKIFLSGGGGAGDVNNGILNSSGTNAGAMVFIQANNLTTNGNKIFSNGATINGNTDSDGGGGGGAGGVIVLEINNYSDNLIINANGGNGTNVEDGIRCPGPGGGGSGGLVWLSQSFTVANLSLVANGGQNGIVNLVPCVGNTNGATSGVDGGFKFNFPNKISDKIFEKMTLFAGTDTTICGSHPAPLFAEVNSSIPYDFQWTWNAGNSFSEEFDFQPDNAGKYNVIARSSFSKHNQYCEEIFIIKVDIRNPEIEIVSSSFFGDTVYIGEPIFVNAVIKPINENYSYTWFPSVLINPSDDRNTTATPYETSEYCLTVTDELNCSNTECIDLYVHEPKIFSQDAFSPNGDGLNDEFMPVLTKDLIVESFTIYNRWGELIYKTTENIPWDGTIKDKSQASESYIWSIKVKQILSLKEFHGLGTVSIVK